MLIGGWRLAGWLLWSAQGDAWSIFFSAFLHKVKNQDVNMTEGARTFFMGVEVSVIYMSV